MEPKDTTRNNKVLRNLAGGAAIAIALTFGGNAILTNAQTQTTAPAATSSQATAPATNNSQTPPATNNNQNGTQNPPQFGGKGSRGPQGPGHGGPGGGGLEGTITAINGSTITLKHDTAVNILGTVNSSTTYQDAGKTITLNDLKVGENVRFNETKNSDGTTTITAVDVVLAHAGGSISAINGDTLTLTNASGTTTKVTVNSATTYMDLGKTISLADLKSGEKVDVAGQSNSDGSISAQVVNVQHDRLGGTVTAINGNSITVQADGQGKGGPRGPQPGNTNNQTNPSTTTTTNTTKTIVVSSSTVYTEAGQSVDLSTLKVGDRVNAEGTLSSDKSSINALQVVIQLPSYRGQVTAINGSTITLQDRNGTHQVEVNSSTKYLNGTSSASLSDIKTGSNLEASGQIDASGKLTAVQIQLGQPQPKMNR